MEQKYASTDIGVNTNVSAQGPGLYNNNANNATGTGTPKSSRMLPNAKTYPDPELQMDESEASVASEEEQQQQQQRRAPPSQSDTNSNRLSRYE